MRMEECDVKSHHAFHLAAITLCPCVIDAVIRNAAYP